MIAVCIAPAAGAPMRLVDEVRAVAGQGLEGDRYCTGKGRFNKGNVGRRQVTLIRGCFFEGTKFEYADSRRNLIVDAAEGEERFELIDLVNVEFQVGEAKFRGIKYCDPCPLPGKLSGKGDFRKAFTERGGIVAEILEGGIIRVNDAVITPSKGY